MGVGGEGVLPILSKYGRWAVVSRGASCYAVQVGSNVLRLRMEPQCDHSNESY